MDDKYYVGYVYIDTPWYSSENQWIYYIKYQVNTSSWGTQHWEEHIINKDTIRPYTKRNMAWLNDLRDIDTVFVNKNYILSNAEKDILGTDVDEVIKKLNEK